MCILAALAFVGAWWLNPVCALLFVFFSHSGSGLLQASQGYAPEDHCIGRGESIGGIVGVLAVDPSPSPGFIALLVLLLAAWEVGGQNIPNDMIDGEEDARVHARTTLTVKGIPEAVYRLVAAASMAAVCGLAIYWVAERESAGYIPSEQRLWDGRLLLEPARNVYYESGSRHCKVTVQPSKLPPVLSPGPRGGVHLRAGIVRRPGVGRLMRS